MSEYRGQREAEVIKDLEPLNVQNRIINNSHIVSERIVVDLRFCAEEREIHDDTS